jgi:putrescine transport system permease protein
MSRAALLRRWLLRAALIAGLLFFYAPIISVVLFSFNVSTSAAVWAGFSLRWYRELLGNDTVLTAAKLSVIIATVSATGATVLGTLVAFVLSRFGRFRSRARSRQWRPRRW